MGTALNAAARGDIAISGDVMAGRRTIVATGENMRHVRHEQVLEHWPLLSEPWARAVEAARMRAVDRTPGAATFGR